ncbi:MAG: hypothetical protein H6838_13575 [Planctomycetes bacterium]|nr:hypothetical protein [Planctomycetota bacterium]
MRRWGFTTWLLAGGVLVALALVIAQVVHLRHQACDDAYITYRFADNLVDGMGLRWNPTSPPCEGYTNLLHLLLIAALHCMGVDLPVASLAVSIAAVLGIVAVLATVIPWRERTAPLVALPTFVLLATQDLRVHASSGLETVLFGFLAVAFVALMPRLLGPARQVGWGMLCGALGLALVWARPDGGLVVVMALAVVTFVCWREKNNWRGAVACGLTFAVALLAYVAWKLVYFGHLLPNPYYMKATQPGWPGLGPTLEYLSAYRWELLVGVGVMAGAAVRRGRAAPARQRDRLVPMITLAVFGAWLAYTARIVHEIGFSHRFSWHLIPLLTFGATAAASGLLGRIGARPWIAAASWLVLALELGTVAWRVPSALSSLGSPATVPPLSQQFERMGVALHDFGRGWDLRILCSNAGITPFLSRAHHIDPAGLTDDGFCRRTPEAERNLYVATMRPDVILWYLPPASAGATSLADDPRLSSSRYIREWCLAAPESMDEGTKVSIRGMPMDHTSQQLFDQAVFLREFTTLVGEMSCGQHRWRMFAYVVRTSPSHDALVKFLSERVDIAAADVDPDGWPPK